MTAPLPDISKLHPEHAQVFLRTHERTQQIFEQHLPDFQKPASPSGSPALTMKVEAMANLAALAQLHHQGHLHHHETGNLNEAAAWKRDFLALEAMVITLAHICVH